MRFNKRKTRRQHKRKNSKSRKFMKGGYTPEQNSILTNHGFLDMQRQHLEDLGVTYEQITNKINEINSLFEDGFQGNSDDFVDAVISGIQQDMNNQNNMDVDTDTDNSMHLSELDISPRSSGYTSEEDFTQNGGKKRRLRTNKKRRHISKKRRSNKQRNYTDRKEK
jgi:hypothetical protein